MEGMQLYIKGTLRLKNLYIVTIQKASVSRFIIALEERKIRAEEGRHMNSER
jgi:hypothetical protein